MPERCARKGKCSLRHPADAIRAGLVLVPANRLVSLLPQRSVQENVALAAFGQLRSWGPIAMGEERRRVDVAVRKLQIDTRAAAEVRRLSGGNMQKVVIARWVAAGFKTLLCFDPTRGIDIGTKKQIYALMREIADQGLSVLLFTSELPEIRLACDRAIVLFGGRISGEMPAAEADEARLLRVAHGLTGAEAAAAAHDRRDGTKSSRAPGERWPAGRVPACRWCSWRRSQRPLAVHPISGHSTMQSLALGALPLAMAAAAQAIVVISGGIDLSIGSMIAVANVLSASLMQHAEFRAVVGADHRRAGRRRQRGRAERHRRRRVAHPRRGGDPDHRLHLGRRGAAHPRTSGWRRAGGVSQHRRPGADLADGCRTRSS